MFGGHEVDATMVCFSCNDFAMVLACSTSQWQKGGTNQW
jgi:hypothetical protein